ncbi:unnamed protein product [Tilletia laevis]|uniref:Uncharacterized protein n=2 Tax=Tilletia TaxID=13289 RepID=A0A8X7SUE3_9BASI|nr:hypothetical protein CF335_g7347 [Tilletia laevis]KAE8189796.1 hypothetical protein CF328_g6167 [Tilletia controversa]CAD6884486.1 unnamed protein product [Tilletia caries]KAE8242436.1 hypothetical protein A4X06_0g6913 [Tilletia controversa]CAD6903887.1 unnamed protein product [Tilletia caries]
MAIIHSLAVRASGSTQRPRRRVHKERIIELCGRRDEEANNLLRGYVNEAIRLNGTGRSTPMRSCAAVLRSPL